LRVLQSSQRDQKIKLPGIGKTSDNRIGNIAGIEQSRVSLLTEDESEDRSFLELRRVVSGIDLQNEILTTLLGAQDLQGITIE